MEKTRTLSRQAQTAKDIRVDLKVAFPGVKFYVKKVAFNTIEVLWFNDTPETLVSNILSKYMSSINIRHTRFIDDSIYDDAFRYWRRTKGIAGYSINTGEAISINPFTYTDINETCHDLHELVGSWTVKNYLHKKLITHDLSCGVQSEMLNN